MKTDKNSRTATTSGTLPHPEQTVSDNNHSKQYKVFFRLDQRSFVSVIVEAASLDGARRKAGEFGLCDFNNWEVFEDDMSIDSIEVVSEGQSHD